MIENRQTRCVPCKVGHDFGIRNIECKGLFTKHTFAALKQAGHHFRMKKGWRGNANQIKVAVQHVAPVGKALADIEPLHERLTVLGGRACHCRQLDIFHH